MTSVQLIDLKGKAVGEVALDDEVFGVEPHEHLMHAAVHRQLANARAGTASTKTRSEVRGGGRKPYRQKGTGNARAGSIRSPLWAGGGVIFGPKPRDFSQSLPKKARRLALRSALAARKEHLVVVRNFDGLFKNPPKAGDDDAKTEQPKTKSVAGMLKELGLNAKRTLLLIDSSVPGCKQVERAARNIPTVKVLCATNLNVKDLLMAEAVLTSEQTLKVVTERYKGHASGATEVGDKPAAKKSAAKAPKAEAAPAKAAKAKAEKPAKAAAEKAPKAEKKSTKKSAE